MGVAMLAYPSVLELSSFYPQAILSGSLALNPITAYAALIG